MLGSFVAFPNGFVAALCAMLMLFDSATMPAKTMDQIQHSPATMTAHEHGGFVTFSCDTVHNSIEAGKDDHRDALDAEDPSNNELPEHHHHHGDSNPSLIFEGDATDLGSFLLSDLHGWGQERDIIGLRSLGLERPPRGFSLTI